MTKNHQWRTFAAMTGSLALAVFCLVLLAFDSHPTMESDPSDATGRGSLHVYCASSNRPVMDAVLAEYRHRNGTEVTVQYGASQTLISTIAIVADGDLYLPADESYLAKDESKDLIAKSFPLATTRAIAVVRRGNPKQIHSLSDLERKDVVLVQANPETAAVGHVTRLALRGSNHWIPLERSTKAFRTSVTEVANDVRLGTADAGIIFEAMLTTYPELQAIELPELQDAKARLEIGLLVGSKHPEKAIELIEFLQSPDGGQAIYARFGFQVDSSPSPIPDGEPKSQGTP
ncbi:molybdate ABC transporter substrate-binding protein [Rubripirellula lacrimiformis]|uniref:molybdate ABC transporter substrate-binding protein n=1 Tax=Rubripirellula lacrimiformis TaxID=1930273 RepID=UPI001C54DBC2|nr:molybdate ABC transporter substrate-binding protein [Rubripirellula lacrimiformis]